MIFEEPCDLWVNKFSFAITWINYILKYIQIENGYFKY